MIYNIKNLKIEGKDLIYGFSDGSFDFRLNNKSAREDLTRQIKAKLSDENEVYTYEIRQVHGNKVVVLEDETDFRNILNDNIYNSQGYDGALTQMKNVALCIRTADCIPVLLYDPVNKVVGALHCGWRGIFGDIVNNAGNMLTDFFKSKLSSVVVMIGPSICKDCFEVKEDFIEMALNKDKQSEKCFSKQNDKTFFDLKQFLKRKFDKAGFFQKNIYDVDLCNFETGGFYSYRKNKTDKRQVSFILCSKLE